MEESSLFITAFPKLLLGALIPIALSAYYIVVTEASSTSKSIIGILLLLSISTVFLAPTYWLWVLLLQVGVGIYIALYLAWDRQ